MFYGALQERVGGPGDALGGLEEERLSCGLEWADVDADFGQALLEVVAQRFGRPAVQVQAKTQPGHERPVDTEIEAAEQFRVAAEQERKRRRLPAPNQR